MADIEHKTLGYAEQHVIHFKEYANAAARTGASGLAAADDNKIALQTDDNTLWILTDYSGPTWVALSLQADGAITAAKLATNAVETLKIKDANVTAAKIGTGAVVVAKLGAAAVETAKIKDANVTIAKLAANIKIINIWIPAGAMTALSTNGAEAGVNEYATNDNMMDYFAFDGATEEFVAFNLVMPENWNRSTFKAKFYWAPGSSACTAGDTVEWQLAGQAISNDDALDVALGDAGEVISDVVLAGKDGDLHIAGATPAITIGGTPALGDMIHFKLSRNVGGSDNMTEDAWLFGVYLQIVTDLAITAW